MSQFHLPGTSGWSWEQTERIYLKEIQTEVLENHNHSMEALISQTKQYKAVSWVLSLQQWSEWLMWCCCSAVLQGILWTTQKKQDLCSNSRLRALTVIGQISPYIGKHLFVPIQGYTGPKFCLCSDHVTIPNHGQCGITAARVQPTLS